MFDTHLAETLLADQSGFLSAFLPAVPAMLFVVDEDLTLLECNAAAASVLDAHDGGQDGGIGAVGFPSRSSS